MGDFAEHVEYFKSQYSDANINNGVYAMKATQTICKGVGKPFGPYLKTLLPFALDNFKHKMKMAIQNECFNFCDTAL